MDARANESSRGHYKEIGEAFIHGWRERKAASLTDPESLIRVWWSWHVQEGGRKNWGGKTEVWDWIMLCFSQKSKAPEQARIGSQWSWALCGKMDLKLIVSVWGFLKVSGVTPTGCACKCVNCQDQWSIPCNMVAVFCCSVCQSAIWWASQSLKFYFTCLGRSSTSSSNIFGNVFVTYH